MKYLNLISDIFFVLGNFFIIASLAGLAKYRNFFVKMHAVNMFNIYGVNFILLAIGVRVSNPVIFFEISAIIILNTLCSLAASHCFTRNALLFGVECMAKSRDKVLKMREKEKEEFYEALREKNKKIEEKRRIREELEKRKLREKEEQKRQKAERKLHQKEEREREKEKEKVLENNKKENIEVKKNLNISDLTPSVNKTSSTTIPPLPALDSSKTPSATAPSNIQNEKMKAEMNENEDLKQKIKEQKKILRKKLETIRRNAFITRKPEEIAKAEKLIKDILEKHNLTEDMLKDDDE
ncbi:MAG: monovalent cation/H(+) antiporter subunit G [Rickettsiales bacterium]|jgi:multisubunit Na+/H+ antiporter MnhG subunit|nr:monovalent cation/H(+) antiporter subunit G [Rickettsiales bacterium]